MSKETIQKSAQDSAERFNEDWRIWLEEFCAETHLSLQEAILYRMMCAL